MDKETIERIKNNPKYQKLVKTRSKFAWKLASFVFVMYYGFILLLAYKPEVLGTSITGGVTTWGIVVGVAIIFISFIITGIYTKRANSEFDSWTKEIKQELKEELNA
ncbi:MAG: DUF485 domain-containing protein [Campylobacterota bacterium]